MVFRHTVVFVTALAVAAGTFAYAGLVHGQAQDPIQFIIAPDTPGPNEPVVIQLEGVGTFLGTSNISWSLNGSVEKSGAGERTFSFTTGALGSRSTVRVVIDSGSQGLITRTLTFSPSLVNMLWEADTTVPPLYKGKALYSAGSKLTVLAFPVVYSGSSRVAASALTFQWFLNDEPLVNQSGRGKSAITFFGDQLRTEEVVTVDVYYGNTKVARGTATIVATAPEIVFYEQSPLRGVLYEEALPGAIALQEKEISVKAEPFYFSRNAQSSGALSYSWLLNGTETSGPDASRGVLTLRQAGSGTGSALIEASLQNNANDQFVQAARSVVQIVFGAQTGGLLNLFGL